MVHNKLLRVIVSIHLLALCAAPLFAQAAFSVASSPTTGADIGVTELTGQISLVISSGTSVAAPFLIQYSAPITNNAASEIVVTGTGGLAGIAATPTILRGSNAILIDVPAGGTTGNLIRIQGVRVALAEGDFSTVTANLGLPTGTGNAIVAGQGIATVVNSIQEPFDVDISDSPPLSFTRGLVTTDTSTFIITEGYPGAFTTFAGDVGPFGQTVPTRIRITPFPAIPAGFAVTFAATATSSSGAILTTTSGEKETIPKADGSTSVVYQLTSAGNEAQLGSFKISVSLSGSAAGSTGDINFQSALVPIGIAVPDGNFPSTDIPRYLERLVPDQSEFPGLSGSVQLAFPVRAQSDATYTGIALTNPLDVSVKVTLTPYDTTGAAIRDPKTLTIPPKGQMAALPTDATLFGPSFNASTAGTIVAVGSTPVLPGFYILGDLNGSRLDGATANVTTLQNWVWPVIFRQAPAPFTILELFNPSSSVASATLTLLDSNGTLIATASQTVAALGTMAQSVQQLFPLANLSAFSGGYVRGVSNVPLVAMETFGNSFDSNVLPGQVGQSLETFYWPHFASGGGYTTELTLVNLDTNTTANFTVTLIDSNGIPTGQAPISIPPLAQTIRSIASLFPALPASQLTSGYVKVNLIPTHIGPFIFTPSVAGSLRFSAADGSGSAALPMVTSASSDFVYSHIAETSSYYTGIAILNTNSTPASISVEVLGVDGTSVGTSSFTLQPGQKIAKLLHELVPAVVGQSGGYVHIESDQPVSSFSLFGSYNGLSLCAIPLQNIGN